MKCADANTWLSFVTATRNCLPSAIASPPTALEQDDADCGAGQIGGGAGILRVAFVSQVAIESGDRRSSRRCASPPGVYHLARSSLHPDRFLGAEFARDVAVGPGRLQREVRLDARVPPASRCAGPAAEGRANHGPRTSRCSGHGARSEEPRA